MATAWHERARWHTNTSNLIKLHPIRLVVRRISGLWKTNQQWDRFYVGSGGGGGEAPSEGFMLQILQDGMWQKGNI